MIVIPAINETDFEEVKNKIALAQDFGASWVHLDVSDGKFTKNKLWNNPADLSKVESRKSKVKIETHLMIENPEKVVKSWIEAGVKRIILHVESVRDWKSIKDICVSSGVELFVAGNPDTQTEEFLKYKGIADGFLALAVTPGKAGQKFQENQLEKIRILRQKMPNVKIEVDGGVNLENVLAIKNAGADILVSASYIWNSESPKLAYKNLQVI